MQMIDSYKLKICLSDVVILTGYTDWLYNRTLSRQCMSSTGFCGHPASDYIYTQSPIYKVTYSMFGI